MKYFVLFLVFLSGCASSPTNDDTLEKMKLSIDEASKCIFNMANGLSNSKEKPSDIAYASFGGCSKEISNMRLSASDHLYNVANDYNDYKVPGTVNDICDRKLEYWRQQIIKMVLERRLKKTTLSSPENAGAPQARQ